MSIDMLRTAETVLSIIAKYDPNACIAGGAVRDTLLVRPVKDIDIWCYVDPQSARFTELQKELLSHPAIVVTDLLQTYAGSGCREIDWVLKLRFMDLDIDVISSGVGFGPNCVALFERFDYGICMVAYRKDEWIISDNFKSDVATNTLTWYPLRAQYNEASTTKQTRKERMLAKYPNFTWRQSEERLENLCSYTTLKVTGC